ncbi:SIS domain-containing protein [Bosea sp. (in: a-proteobacteria)]|uniref:SIS domain-containing protein n=1 Tax=Bosea sp. (in: a-proteobacteria) TaxID=1871050 RepID=UPI0027367FDC|nr:SIS domain-containing protein [Bosea sp. (in: a-proteobacteria)]MDP3255185.1 SIS domain-containing protein [Bosea sp. (in: a-proteobacteria)]
MASDSFGHYVAKLVSVVESGHASDRAGADVAIGDAVERMGRLMHAAHQAGHRVFFVGNGGSAGICSHMATDYSKNGGIRSLALNDGSVLTCLGNDYGYEHVFSKQLEWHAEAGDIVVTISSSGRSQNILNAANMAREKGCTVFTLSGFKPDNPLRSLGDINIYLANLEYGFVEVGHLAVLHAVLDIHLGWQKAGAA